MKISTRPEKQRLSILVSTAVLLAAVATLLRIICLVLFYDNEIGYYFSGAILPIVSNTFYLLSIIALIAGAILLRPEQEISLPDKPSSLAALLPAGALACHFIFLLIEANNLITELGADVFFDILFAKAVPGVRVTMLNIILLLLALISSAIASAFFISLSFSKHPSNLTIGLGCGLILWISVVWMRSYVDFYVALNSPDKLFFHFACIGAILFAVAELRALYCISKPKTYWLSLLGAIFCLSVSTVSNIIGSFTNIFAAYNVELENIVLFTMLIYASVRAVRLISDAEDAPEESEPENTASNETDTQ